MNQSLYSRSTGNRINKTITLVLAITCLLEVTNREIGSLLEGKLLLNIKEFSYAQSTLAVLGIGL